jgi:hypothetical protein
VANRLVWTAEGRANYDAIKADAKASLDKRKTDKSKRATKVEGLFKQVHGCLQKLLNDPRHPGLQTHKFDSLEHPYDKKQPVFEAYVQNRTPGAYRLFWCYGPNQNEITIIAITSHP